MSNDFFFKELDVEFKGQKILQDFLPTATWEWIPYMNVCNNFGDDFKKRFINTATYSASTKLIIADKFVNDVVSHFGIRQRLYNIPANSTYKWHVDLEVAFSLNMILDDYDCKTVFEVEKISPQLSKIVEIKYTPHKWYLFNSQKLHTVINTDSRDRPLYTILFYKDHKYSLQNFLDWYDKSGYNTSSKIGL